VGALLAMNHSELVDMISNTPDSDVVLLGRQIEYLNTIISYNDATYELW